MCARITPQGATSLLDANGKMAMLGGITVETIYGQGVPTVETLASLRLCFGTLNGIICWERIC